MGAERLDAVVPSSAQEQLRAEISAVYRTFFEDQSPLSTVRSAAPLGFRRDLWNRYLATDPYGMVFDDGGHAGVHIGVLGGLAYEAGRHLAPIPIVETMVVARALAGVDAGHVEEARRLSRLMAEDGEVATLTPRPIAGDVAHDVPAGALARFALAHRDGCLVALMRPDPVMKCTPNLADLPIDDWDTRDTDIVVLGKESSAALYSRAVDEWHYLTSEFLAGLSARAVEIATDYAKVRLAFGRPIGSFQAVAHQLADVSAVEDSVRLLLDDAADRLECPSSASAAVGMAFIAATRLAREATRKALHVHGGYGYTLEQDIQLYFRRAWGVSLLAGSSGEVLERYGSTILGCFAREADGEGGADADVRAAVRALAADFPADFYELRFGGSNTNLVLHKELAARRWLNFAWPAAYGGYGDDPGPIVSVYDELDRCNINLDYFNPTVLVAQTVIATGTPEQARWFSDLVVRGEAIVALGYSEPESGSDVASTKTRAIRDGDHWVITGQKMFTSYAKVATHIFLLARTDPGAAKHHGLTLFLIPADTPGITIDKVPTLGGYDTYVTFYDGVRVPDDMRIGAENAGWSVMRVALAYEHGVWRRNLVRELVEHALRWAGFTEPGPSPRLRDSRIQSLLVDLVVDSEIARLIGRERSRKLAAGEMPGTDGPAAKLITSEAFVRATESILDMVGPSAMSKHGAGSSAEDGWFEMLFRRAPVATIYGGSSEIQRDILAERRLGMPRQRPR